MCNRAGAMSRKQKSTSEGTEVGGGASLCRWYEDRVRGRARPAEGTAGVKTLRTRVRGDAVRNGAMKVKRWTWLLGRVTSYDFPCPWPCAEGSREGARLEAVISAGHTLTWTQWAEWRWGEVVGF